MNLRLNPDFFSALPEYQGKRPPIPLSRLIPLTLAFAVMAAAGNRPAVVDAARNGDREALSTMLRKGADVNAAEGDGSTALLWASYRDDLDSAGLLIGAMVGLIR